MGPNACEVTHLDKECLAIKVIFRTWGINSRQSRCLWWSTQTSVRRRSWNEKHTGDSHESKKATFLRPFTYLSSVCQAMRITRKISPKETLRILENPLVKVFHFSFEVARFFRWGSGVDREQCLTYNGSWAPVSPREGPEQENYRYKWFNIQRRAASSCLSMVKCRSRIWLWST